MKAKTHDERTKGGIGGYTWGALVVLGLVVLVLHNSAWASAWVTASAIVFTLLVVWAVLATMPHRR